MLGVGCFINGLHSFGTSATPERVEALKNQRTPKPSAFPSLIDAAEIDHRHSMGGGDEVAVDAAQHADDIVLASEFGIFSLDVPGAEVVDRFDFYSVENGRVELLSAAKAWANGHPHDHSRSVFVTLVT